MSIIIRMDDYGFRDVGETCGVCRKTFGKEEDLFSGLSRQQEKFERLDFCDSCWQAVDKGTLFCFWKRKPRIKETQPTVDGNVVFDIFQRLESSDERHDRNFRYILALLLMRRKRLKFLDVERAEHGEFLVLEDRQLDGVKYRLLDPGMSEEEMQKAKDEVDKLFSVNVDKEEPEDGAKTEGETEAEAASEVQASPAVVEGSADTGEIEGGEGSSTIEAPAAIEDTIPNDEANDGQSVSEVHKS